MEHASDPLSFFSTVTLYGLAISDSNSGSASEPLTLLRTQSFPARRDKGWPIDECPTETDAEWKARALPVGKPHADFELLERLGEGRISIVFAARLVCLRQCPGGEPLPDSSLPSPLPDKFCVKLAKAEFIRSLARDTWFYEQLAKEDGYQGVITPLCFGFFTTLLPSTLQIRSWSEIKCIPKKHDRELVYDRFYDDDSSNGFTDDLRTCRANCPWSLEHWISRNDCSPIVGVLIMEGLGEHFPSDSDCEWLLKESEPEIMDILDDLSSVGILHGDVKFNNILRPGSTSLSSSSSSYSPSSSRLSSSSSSSSCVPQWQICPRHKRSHTWRIIDFDRATKWGKSIPGDNEHFTKVQKVEFQHGFFWGGT